MKKPFRVLILIVIAAALSFPAALIILAQRADYRWNPDIADPTFTSEHPRVLFDEGHYNASSIGFSGRYWPFARLLRADGSLIEQGQEKFTPSYLNRVQILIIANATGAPQPQYFGINIPVSTTQQREDPAFTVAEVEVVLAWVERGGSLFLIADHSPFGEAASILGDTLGVTMHGGFVEIPGELSDPMLFSAENGRLADHPIIIGNQIRAEIKRVMTYTGQSLDGPPLSTPLLILPETAIEWVPSIDGTLIPQAAGQAQGLSFELGQGRVVVLGEAGMVTAQVSELVPYGMNINGNDNKQFVLNIMRWLARKL